MEIINPFIRNLLRIDEGERAQAGPFDKSLKCGGLPALLRATDYRRVAKGDLNRAACRDFKTKRDFHKCISPLRHRDTESGEVCSCVDKFL